MSAQIMTTNEKLRWVIGMAAPELTTDEYAAAHEALDELTAQAEDMRVQIRKLKRERLRLRAQIRGLTE